MRVCTYIHVCGHVLASKFGRQAKDLKTLKALGCTTLPASVAKEERNLMKGHLHAKNATGFAAREVIIRTIKFMHEAIGERVPAAGQNAPEDPYRCGIIDFSGSPRQAPYIIVDASTFTRERQDFSTLRSRADGKNQQMLKFIEMMVQGMGVKPPRLVISVSGEQDDIVAPDNLERVLRNGLAETSDLWVITNGLNQGASQLVAKLVNTLRASSEVSDFSIPVIGIIPYCLLKYKALFQAHKDVKPQSRKVSVDFADYINGASKEVEGIHSMKNELDKYTHDNNALPPIDVKPKSKLTQNAGIAPHCRVTYPTNSWKDLDEFHTHFIVVKSKADFKQDDAISNNIPDFETAWQDTLTVRDAFEDAIKGSTYKDLKKMYDERLMSFGKSDDKQQSNRDPLSDNDFLDNATRIHTLQLIIGGADRVSAESTLQVMETAVIDLITLSPIVVIEGTGGIADLIVYAWRMLHATSPIYTGLTREELETNVRKIFKIFDDAEAKKCVSRICNICATSRKIVPFHLALSDGSDLDEAMLTALYDNMQTREFVNDMEARSNNAQGLLNRGKNKGKDRLKLEKLKNSDHREDKLRRLKSAYHLNLDKLRIAMAFDREAQTRALLQKLRNVWNEMELNYNQLKDEVNGKLSRLENSGENETERYWNGFFDTYQMNDDERLRFQDQVCLALEWALIEGKIAMVQEIISQLEIDSSLFEFLYDATAKLDRPKGVDPASGYKVGAKPDSKKDVYGVGEDKQRGEYCALYRLYSPRGELRHPMTRKGELTDAGYLAEVLGIEVDPDHKIYANRVMHKIRKTVKNLTFDTATGDRWVLTQQYGSYMKDYSVEDQELMANQELMIWSALMNRYDMAEFFWKNGGNAIGNALICSRVCLGFANDDVLLQGKYQDFHEGFLEMSKQFESLAINVLSRCYQSDAAMAQTAILSNLTAYQWLRYPDEAPSCLRLAALAENKDFISHPAAQAVIDKLWRGEDVLKAKPFSYFSWTYVKSPVAKFNADFIAFIVLVVLYTSVSLQPMDVNAISQFEWILFVWFVTLFLNEAFQTFQDGFSWGSLTAYINDRWNNLDLLMILFFFACFILRSLSITDTYGMNDVNVMRTNKAMYGLNNFLVYIRTLKYFKKYPGIGPKIQIFTALLTTMLPFLLLLAIFIVAYGVFVQTIYHPFTPVTGTTFWRTVYRPYFQIYGELMLDDMNAESSCMGETMPFTDCAYPTEMLVPLVTVLYLIITSIVILNMLIASFTNTYQSIEENSAKVFRLNSYQLYEDYANATLAPMPLGVFELFIRMYSIAKNAVIKSSGDGTLHAGSQDIELKEKVELFQDVHADNYVDELHHHTMSVDERMSQIVVKLDNAYNELKLASGRDAASAAADEANGGGASSAKESPKDLAEPLNSDSYEQKAFFEYNIQRYKGQVFQQTAQQMELSDPRTKMYRCAALDAPSAPNPRLTKQCENHFLLHIVTRWKRDENGIKMMRGGKPMLECVAVKRTREEENWAIPECPKESRQAEDPASPILRHAFNMRNKKDEVTDEQFKLMIERIEGMLEGETQIYNVSKETASSSHVLPSLRVHHDAIVYA